MSEFKPEVKVRLLRDYSDDGFYFIEKDVIGTISIVDEDERDAYVRFDKGNLCWIPFSILEVINE